MSRRVPEIEPELESLLRFHQAARHIPDDLRARVLARSRASVIGRRVSAPLSLLDEPRSSRTPGRRARGRSRIAVAAAVAVIAAAVGAAAALRNRTSDIPPPALARFVSPPAVIRDEPMPTPMPTPTRMTTTTTATRADQHLVRARPRHSARAGAGDPLAEVTLLRRATVAYARKEFADALALVAEHARRFPRGPLSEECEALRVESLVGSGRVDEAQRAGVAFAARFPRSVLRARVEQASHDRD